jgi:hypothetical protein
MRIFVLGLESEGTSRINDSNFLPWITAYVGLTLSLNILCTGESTCLSLAHLLDALTERPQPLPGMIAARIVAVMRRSADTRLKMKWSGYAQSAARVVIESGLMYTIWSAIQIGVAPARHPLIYPVADCVYSVSLLPASPQNLILTPL